MKKILAIILAVLMCISSVAMIASCSNKDDTDTPTENTTPSGTEAPTDTPTEPPTEAPTDEPEPEPTILDEAMDYIHQLYRDSLQDTGNYDLIKAVKIGDVTFNVTWTISGTDAVTIVEKNDTLLTVVVPKAEEAFQYTLTASITHEGETVTRDYVHTVPKFEIAGFDAYMAAKAGDSVVVQGIVTSISSKSQDASYNNLYLQDLNGDGGYYIYSIKDGVDPVADLNLAVGMTVSVSGIKDIYNKVHEVKDSVIEVLDTTVKTIDYIDITDIAKAAKNAEADELTNFQGCWVTIKGVEVTTQYLAQYYYKWIIGNVDSYTRLSLSSGLAQSVLDEIAAGHTAHTGYSADVKGIVNVYNGAFYLVPLGADAFTYGALAEVADSVKVEREKTALTVNNKFTTASKLTLPVVGATYNTVSIAWTTENTDVLTIAADGKVTFLKAGTATLKATLTLGTETAEVTFTVTVEEPTIEAVKPVVGTAYKIAMIQTKAGKTVFLKGGMSGYYMATTETFAEGLDFYVEETTGGYYVYTMIDGVKTYIDMVVSGTYVNANYVTTTPSTVLTYNETLKTFVGVVNGEEYVFGTRNDNTYTTVGCNKVSYEPFNIIFVAKDGGSTTPDDKNYVTDKDALDALYALESGASENGDYKITGTIIALDSYNNPTIVVTGYDNMPVYCYRLTDDRFVVGATVTVTATQIKNYNGTYEFMNCAVVSVGGSTTPDTPVTPPTAIEPVKPVVGSDYKLGFTQTKENKIYYLTGVEGGYNNYYTDVTENWADAAVFGIEETTGGYYLFCTVNGAKKYLNMVTSGTHVNPKFQDTASTVYTYSETLKTFVSTVNDAEYAFSTYGDYKNPGPSTTDKTSNYYVYFVAATSTPGGNTPGGDPVIPPVTDAEVDVKYTFSEMEKGEQYASENRVLDDNTTLITTDCHITTELRIYKAEAGGNAYSEWPARNGVAIIKSVKPLENIVLNIGNKKTTFTISASVDGVNYVQVAVLEITDTEYQEYVIDLSGARYKYVKLETTSQGRVKYIGLNFAEATAEDFYVAEKPVVGTKYNFVIYQAAAGKFVYVNGLMNGYYMDTNTSVDTAVNFYVEETEGGYYLYTMIDGYKIYLNMVADGTYVNGKYQPTPSTVYTYDEDLKTLVATVNGKTYAFGTRSDKTYTTIGPVVATQYDPFLAQFAISINDDAEASEPTGGVIITVEDANKVMNSLPEYGATTYNKYGVKGEVVAITDTTITLKDSAGNIIVIKNVFNGTGEVALKDMATKPAVGDTIVVLGALTNIGGDAMVNGWISQHSTHTCVWKDATCAAPKTCEICGATDGDALTEHTDWVDATCKEAAHCTVCGATDGEALTECQGWVDATCSEYGYCTVCGKVGTEYDADNHVNVKAATCIAGAYCTDCETTLGEADPDAHGNKTKPTCIRPETCKLCGTQFGEVSGEHGEIVDCQCTICKATVHTGDLSEATCMAPSKCSACEQNVGTVDANNHVGFSVATCTTPATCECGVTQGDVDPDAHGELGAACLCPICEKNIHKYEDSCVCSNGCGVPNHVFETGAKTCKYCAEDNPYDLTIPEANDLGSTYAKDAYSTAKYTVTGIIVKIEASVYGNMYIRNEAGEEFYVYGLYSADGSTRYDAMSVKPKVGDTITVYGVIGKYTAPQMKNGWMLVHEIHETCSFAPATCKAPETCTVCGKTQGTTVAHNYVDTFCSSCGIKEGAVTVTGAYTNTTTTTNMTLNTNNASKIGLDANVFTVTPDKGDSSSVVGLNKAGNFRLYGNASKNGNTLTFAVANGTIQFIKITFANTTNNANCQVLVNGVAVATSTSADKTLEVDINAAEFVLKNVNASTTQVHIASIEITYYLNDNGGSEGGDDIGGGEGEDDTTVGGGEDTSTEEDTTVGGETPVEKTATFDFSKNTSTSSTALTNATMTTLMNNCYTGGVAFTVGSTVSNTYPGNSSSGLAQGSDLLKMGKSSGGGVFTLDFGTAKITKVVVNCYKWSATEGALSINSSATQAPASTSAEDLTFEFANGVSSLEFSSTKRVLITSITIYFE